MPAAKVNKPAVALKKGQGDISNIFVNVDDHGANWDAAVKAPANTWEVMKNDLETIKPKLLRIPVKRIARDRKERETDHITITVTNTEAGGGVSPDTTFDVVYV